MKAARQGIDSSRGFTLLEILVVMVIAALMVALVPPLFSGAVSGTRLKGSVRDLAVALRETRSQAIIHNAERLVHLDLKTPRYRVGNGKLQNLPDNTNMAVQTITGDYVEKTVPHVVRFFPDGSSSGELITIKGYNHTYHVHLNWLTGGIAISEGSSDAG